MVDGTDAGLEDRELLAAVAGRQPEALGALYDRHGAVLLGLLRRMLGSGEEAEDVLQEALVQVWRQAGRYDATRASVSTWMALIARSRAIDRIRARTVRARSEEQLALEPGSHADASSGAVAAVLDGQRRSRIRGALAELPAEQREVLEMAYYDGMTQREIADGTGIPLGTVKTRTLLAMRKLRESLRPEIEELL